MKEIIIFVLDSILFKKIIISILDFIALICFTFAIFGTISLIAKDMKKDKKEIASCDHCKHLYFNNDGSADCDRNISKDALRSFNEDNIRPCKVLEDNNGKEE